MIVVTFQYGEYRVISKLTGEVLLACDCFLTAAMYRTWHHEYHLHQ